MYVSIHGFISAFVFILTKITRAVKVADKDKKILIQQKTSFSINSTIFQFFFNISSATTQKTFPVIHCTVSWQLNHNLTQITSSLVLQIKKQSSAIRSLLNVFYINSQKLEIT